MKKNCGMTTFGLAMLVLGMVWAGVGRAADEARTSPASTRAGVGVAQGGTESVAAVVDVSEGLPKKLRVVAAVPGKDKVLAFAGEGYGPATGWSTTDGGATWKELGKGAGSEKLTIQPLGILFDPEHSDTFWVFGNFKGKTGGVMVSTDGGETFAGLHCEEAEGFSVDFSDPKRQTMVVGRHEHSQEVYKSADGGKTWTDIGKTLPAGTARSQYPLVIDAQTYLIGCSFTIPYGIGSMGGTPGIYRTADGGKSWTKVSDAAVFGNPLVVGGKIYWSSCNKSKGDGGVVVSADKGLTWKAVTEGGLNYAVAPMEISAGKIATMKKSKFMTVSADGGASWTDVAPTMGLNDAAGATYDAVRKAFFAWKVNGAVRRLDVP